MRQFVFAAVAALCAVPAIAQPLTSAPDGRPAVFGSVGYFRGNGFWNAGEGPSSVLTLRVGGEVPVFRRAGTGDETGLSAVLGVALQAADSRLQRSIESGLRPQSAEVYGRLAGGVGQADVSATVGFVLDVGPSRSDYLFGYLDLDEDYPPAPNSDGQNALRLGVDGAVPVGRVRALAGVEGVLTFAGTFEDRGIDGTRTEYPYDDGDYLTGYAGAALRLSPAVEAGVRIVGVYRTDESFDGQSLGCVGNPDDPDCDIYGSRSVVSVVPHVRYARPGSALALTLTGEATGGYYVGEHTRYGVGVTGDGEPKVWLPITVAARYAF